VDEDEDTREGRALGEDSDEDSDEESCDLERKDSDEYQDMREERLRELERREGWVYNTHSNIAEEEAMEEAERGEGEGEGEQEEGEQEEGEQEEGEEGEE